MGVKGVEEDDCISLLEGYWRMQKQKGRFFRFASDFLDKLNSMWF